MQKINVKAFALAWGITCSAYAIFIGWTAMFGWGVQLVESVSSLYIGFAPTFLGGIIGGAWAFCDGAIAGLIIALVYNAMIKEKKE